MLAEERRDLKCYLKQYGIGVEDVGERQELRVLGSVFPDLEVGEAHFEETWSYHYVGAYGSAEE